MNHNARRVHRNKRRNRARQFERLMAETIAAFREQYATPLTDITPYLIEYRREQRPWWRRFFSS